MEQGEAGTDRLVLRGVDGSCLALQHELDQRGNGSREIRSLWKSGVHVQDAAGEQNGPATPFVPEKKVAEPECIGEIPFELHLPRGPDG
jgi:hypothetical protein